MATDSPTPALNKNPQTLLAADLLVVDDLIAMPTEAELASTSDNLRDRYTRLETLLTTLLSQKGLKRGDRISITAEDFRQLSEAAAGIPARTEPAGSTADILTTYKNLLGNEARIHYLGVAGQDGTSDNLITQDLHRHGIELSPGATQGASAAVSFVFTYPDGKQTYVTYPGDAATKLTAGAVTDEKVQQSDSVFIPISLWSKFDKNLPDTLFRKALEQDKKIIVSLPKQARFDYGNPGDVHTTLLPGADIIVADEEELARVYKTAGNREQTIRKLEADMARHDALRLQAGKPPRSTPATALIKYADDSVTVLVAPSGPRVSPPMPAARYDIAAPAAISGKKHTLGVDDAIYAGFLAALSKNMSPDKAAEFAMNIAQAKYAYDSVRIPSPVGADHVTQQQWKQLRSGLGDTIVEVSNVLAATKVGSQSIPDNGPRTPGQKIFDVVLYPLIANIGVWVLSIWVTYHSNFNQNKTNWFVKRSTWAKEQISHNIPGLDNKPDFVKKFNMVLWSFIDGSLMAPVVAWFESKRQPISRWFDDKLGTTPEDKTVYDKDIHRSRWDVIFARITTFAFVIATFFTLNKDLFPNSTRKGILEAAGDSGTFTRSDVKSINGFVFDIPSKWLGGVLAKIGWVENWAKGISQKQLDKMATAIAEKENQSVMPAKNIMQKLWDKVTAVFERKPLIPGRPAGKDDARYQIEGMINTGLFEFVYTSLCTAGLYFLGKTFGKLGWFHHKEEPAPVSGSRSVIMDGPPRNTFGSSELNTPTEPYASRIEKTERAAPQKAATHIEAVDKSRSFAAQPAL